MHQKSSKISLTSKGQLLLFLLLYGWKRENFQILHVLIEFVYIRGRKTWWPL